MNTHGITNTPVICSPGTNHYSWPKGATLLGIGDKNIKEIHVDENARQSIESKYLYQYWCSAKSISNNVSNLKSRK